MFERECRAFNAHHGAMFWRQVASLDKAPPAAL